MLPGGTPSRGSGTSVRCRAGLVSVARLAQPWFQSPTSRGDLCNYQVGLLVALGVKRFQSPTSRGGLCNPPPSVLTGSAPHRVSIPYFAGRPLQRGDPRSSRHPGGGFNPLLRGAASATHRCGVRSIAPSRVSIPYFAGRPLQLVSPYLAGVEWDGFQSPTSRGGLCNRHSELEHPSLASPPEAVVVVSSSASNWEGGGQPPLVWGGFEVDHPIGVLRSGNLIAPTQLGSSASHIKVMNIAP
jgi:hypothetical protein